MRAPQAEGKYTTLGHGQDQYDQGLKIPLSIKILDQMVSSYIPGGPGVRRKKARDDRKVVPGRRAHPRCKPVRAPTRARISSLLEGRSIEQTKKVLDILFPTKDPVRREVLQFGLSLLLQILESYPTFATLPVEAQLSCITTFNRWEPSQFVKNAKHLTCWPFAKFTRQELPQVNVDHGCLRRLGFTGRAGNYIRNLYAANNRRNWRFFWGLLQGTKRGCCTINESFIEDAYAKHKKALTKPLEECQIDLQAAGRLAGLAWDGTRTEVRFTLPPSFAASFLTSRKEGGKMKEIQDLCRENHTIDEVGLINDKSGALHRVEGLSLPVKDAVRTCLDDPNLRNVRVVMVREPLKARPITAGNGLGGYVGGIGQRDMWNQLYHKFPCCCLIGRPLEVDDLQRLDRDSPLEFDHWVSGDYSAATDNLDIRLSKVLFERFLDHSSYDPDLKDVLRAMLYEQHLHYPDGDTLWQTNGQLMGSPLSFPILCVANLVAYAITWERYFDCKLTTLRHLPVLVNGDDILFKANDLFYKMWQHEVKKVGFELSIGKSYYSTKFLTVNSKLYRISGVNNDNFTLVTFFNPSQALPTSWITPPGDDHQDANDFAGRMSDLLERTVDERFALRCAIRFNKREIALATRCGLHNMFIPQHLGGLGIKCPEQLWQTEKVWVTPFQTRLAYACNKTTKSVVLTCVSGNHTRGFVQPTLRYSAVIATVSPEGVIKQPSLLNHQIDQGERFWSYPKVHLSSRDMRCMSVTDIRNSPPRVLEITPCEENDNILIDIEYGQAIHMPFGVWNGVRSGRNRPIPYHVLDVNTGMIGPLRLPCAESALIDRGGDQTYL